MRLIKHSFFYTLAVSLLSLSPAYSQDNIPSLESLNTGIEDFSLPIPDVNINDDFVSENPYFNETLKLHYQIGLLEKMIRRQSYIAKLEDSYINLGMPFVEPAPPLGICEQIPANIPCARAYPDLYQLSLPSVDIMDLISIGPLNLDMLTAQPQTEKQPTKVAKLSDKYRWNFVTCGGGNCKGTLISLNNPNKEIAVQEGDTLEDGKIKIVSITSDGVSLSENNEVIKLELAEKEAATSVVPPVTVPNEPKFEQVPSNTTEERILEQQKIKELMNMDPIQFPEMPEADAPALGPTGLF